MNKASAHEISSHRFGESSEKIDLNKLLITNETATLFCRVSGRSMEPHMRDGDVLMVDKSIEPKVCKVIIAAIKVK
jgi:phage repressor protein C with HTH and peptisase S24 domain